MRIPASTLAFLLLALPCAAQQSQQSSDQSRSPGAQQNESQSSGQPQAQDQSKSADKSQAGQQAPAKHHSTAEDNPFPEDISKKAAASAGNATPDAPAAKSDQPPSSAAGSKSAPDYSSSRTGLKDLESNDPEARISDGAGGYIYDPKLAKQDVKVGGFYYTNQDYKGAYSRFKEATKVDPTNPDAVFGLAEAARALKLTSEAADNYRVYLDAFPDGSKAKAARKALAQLSEAPKK